jgi:hypothetical protein
MLHTSLTQDPATIARIRARPRSLSGQSGTGTLGLIMTSGWVMKKTVGMGLSGRTKQFNRNLALRQAVTKMGKYRFTQLPGSDFAWRPSNLTFVLLRPI